MKVLVLGYFGYVTNQIDGQTIKTRDIYNLLEENCKDEVEFFDTQLFKKSKISLLKMFFMIFKSDVLFYLPAHNNLKYLFPLIYIVSKLGRVRVNYLVVGGWLFDFLKKKPVHRYMLSKLSGIYTETENLFNNLKSYNFNNVYKLHNFRISAPNNLVVKTEVSERLKLVFMARVHPMKGIGVIFKLSEEIKKRNLKADIDIYGPIFNDYSDEFFSNVDLTSVRYLGVLDPLDIYGKLNEYDLMLFPTKYYTEGFPGTILDSYIAGIPVVVTNWLNAHEFVDDEKTGCVVEFNNEELFIEKIIELISNPEKIYNLKGGVGAKKNQYSSARAWEILENSLYGN
ncbi:glycosyltransferase [Acinetobacter vivianii]|uniref:glycosyltransferase n=1 Tax=Acinetobacter vivianii TaxID=1776742 RepID=UPI002DB6A86F|nr:glycosyltransferase [Acinetobacter vivianii]MEB6481019.1 glycosyltransferase [Acinetobacter vivianii]MEB6659303.1 glycosyltransferase [Acinetobacter vivianii]